MLWADAPSEMHPFGFLTASGRFSRTIGGSTKDTENGVPLGLYRPAPETSAVVRRAEFLANAGQDSCENTRFQKSGQLVQILPHVP